MLEGYPHYTDRYYQAIGGSSHWYRTSQHHHHHHHHRQHHHRQHRRMQNLAVASPHLVMIPTALTDQKLVELVMSTVSRRYLLIMFSVASLLARKYLINQGCYEGVNMMSGKPDTKPREFIQKCVRENNIFFSLYFLEIYYEKRTIKPILFTIILPCRIEGKP